MTYWATLWYAGAVVFQLGYEGQTLADCEVLRETMLSDIQAIYTDPTETDELALTLFPTNEFEVTCEIEVMPTDEMYAK